MWDRPRLQTFLVMGTASLLALAVVRGFHYLDTTLGEGPLHGFTVGAYVALIVLAGGGAIAQKRALAVFFSLLAPSWLALEVWLDYVRANRSDAENFTDLVFIMLAVPAMAATFVGNLLRPFLSKGQKLPAKA